MAGRATELVFKLVADDFMMICMPCPSGKFSAANGAACEDCTAGKFSTMRLPVSAGTTVMGATACTGCAAGTWARAAAPNCQMCPGGRSAAAGAGKPEDCIACAAGKSAMPGAASCTGCAAGTWAAEAASSCKTCPGGRSAAAGASKPEDCFMCVVGWFAPPGAACTMCAAGMFSDMVGAAACKTCPHGQALTAGGKTMADCVKCAAGKFASPGMAACTDCAPGKFSDSVGGYCVNCPQGKALPEGTMGKSMTDCIVCAAGKYANFNPPRHSANPDPVALFCTNCAAGKFSAGADRSMCHSCPTGKSSVAGSWIAGGEPSVCLVSCDVVRLCACGCACFTRHSSLFTLVCMYTVQYSRTRMRI